MAVHFVSVKCPECGANLPMEEGRKEMFCSFCGTKVIMYNDNEHIYRHIDEAKIKKAEAEKAVRMRELDIAEKADAQSSGLRKVLTVLWIILSLIIIALCIVKWAVQDDFINGFLMLFYLGGPVIGGGGYLIFKVLPDKEKDKSISRSGGIRFPKGLEPFEDKKVEAVKAALESAGFYNIQCINLHDIKLIRRLEGRVESICVNGEKVLTGGRVYMPNASITITYHGK